MSFSELASLPKKPRVVKRDGKGNIDFLLPTGSWSYWIPEKEVQSEKGLLRWIRHLLPKQWITKDTIEQLIDIAEEIKTS